MPAPTDRPAAPHSRQPAPDDTPSSPSAEAPSPPTPTPTSADGPPPPGAVVTSTDAAPAPGPGTSPPATPPATAAATTATTPAPGTETTGPRSCYRAQRRLWARPGVALLLDAAAWLVGIVTAVEVRYESGLRSPQLKGALTVVLLAVCAHGLIGQSRHLYRRRYAFGSFDEVRAVCLTVLSSAALLLLVDLAAARWLLTEQLVPASSPLVGGAIALVLMLGVRWTFRVRRERHLLADRPTGAPALLFGAGSAGHDLVRAMLRDQRAGYRPVGLLDDDPDKSNLRVHGVPVVGGRSDLAAAVRRTGATTVIFSVANAESGLIGDVQRLAVEARTTFKVVPSIGELLDGRISLSDVRDVSIDDLLGRHQIDTDVAAVAGYLTGKRVLITGAGGSIGSELCRQVQRFHPGELIMLDRDESALHAVQLSLSGRALLDSSELVLADLRDTETIRALFAARAPQVVFHAAALKHLPLLERYPAEALKTNVWGTLTTLEQAGGVERFVNISTDKAANPISVLGYSKRITERLTAYAATNAPGTFLNVRFGNVLGSRGSVLTAFTAQAAAGGPITVTHPDVTRYFMTVREAVQLVIQAAALGRDGEALVLDMGRPILIRQVAEHLAAQAGRPVDIVYTGLRPGEKLHEELFAHGEEDLRPYHPLISHVAVPPLHPEHARRLDPTSDDLVADLAAACAIGTQPPVGAVIGQASPIAPQGRHPVH